MSADVYEESVGPPVFRLVSSEDDLGEELACCALVGHTVC